jgi:AraC-like DNA-binding protein
LTISCQDQKILIIFFQLLISSQFLAGQQISIPNLGNFGKLIFGSLKKAQKLDLLLRSSAPAHNLSDSLQQAIAPFLKEHYPSVQLAANLSQMSVRTLQRRLTEDQLTYSQLVTRLRYQRALQLLGDRQIKIIDIAIELGYQDAAHFTRAFKQWTGTTPQHFRRSLTGLNDSDRFMKFSAI